LSIHYRYGSDVVISHESIGPIVAGLTGLAAGAGAGVLVGGLIGLGIPEQEAKRYNEYLEDGHILVLVDSNSDWD
jgi:uncharacterized membrane protein